MIVFVKSFKVKILQHYNRSYNVFDVVYDNGFYDRYFSGIEAILSVSEGGDKCSLPTMFH